jgi:hypothetical protein
MQYYCFIYLPGSGSEVPSPDVLADGVNAMLDNDETLRQSGHYILSDALKSPEAATSVRIRNGKLSVTDGPFAETKEYLSGFIKIEARDLNEAIQVAGAIPLARVGTIEVRPVEQLERTDTPQ